MRGVTTTTRPEALTMLHVDCPVCGDAAPYDEASDALVCERCGVCLELAAETEVLLPAAA
jgi:ribosomal protein S27AE